MKVLITTIAFLLAALPNVLLAQAAAPDAQTPHGLYIIYKQLSFHVGGVGERFAQV